MNGALMPPMPPMPPECLEVLQHVWDFLDNQLTDETAERLRTHLSECHGCFEFKTFQTQFLDAAAALQRRPGAPPALREKVLATLREQGFAK